MKNRILQKEKLPEFLEGLMARNRVIAPVEEGDHSVYRPLEKAGDLCLDYIRPRMSAKEVFFPQNEVMFYYNKRTQKMAEPEDAPQSTVLFGVPSCDLAGIEAQDRLFRTGDYQDPYYEKKRGNAVIIGMGCPEPEETCFCHHFGIERLASNFADLFFVPLEEKYYIQVNTTKGDELVQELQQAQAGDEEKVKQLREKPVEFSGEPVPLQDLVRAMPENFKADFWDDLAMKCIGCAACTFVCPTCHCFDITDEGKRELGRRVRTWDGCMFPKFTLHASGHNPRTSAGQRVRQRVLHKFSYFRDNQGVISCTGCGRCIEVCPTGMDIRDILKAIAGEVLKKKKK